MKPIAGRVRLQVILALLIWHTSWFQNASGLSLVSNPTKTQEIETSSSDVDSSSSIASSSNDYGSTITTASDTSRRSMIGGGGMGALSLLASSLVSFPDPTAARAPGSKDVVASIQQIQDAANSLKTLQANWEDYASIDGEGRARSTDGARRILGGIAPQAGAAAIDAAKNTPLYRIDVAFVTIRKAVLEGSDKSDAENTAWRDKLDLERFEELADRVIYGTQKADGNFYSVLFAMKGTTMINDIFGETKKLVQQGIDDLENMVLLLQEAGAPGV